MARSHGPERIRDVALPAAAPEGTLVNVVVRVTGAAQRRRPASVGIRTRVAVVACDALVRSVECERGPPRVVEVPDPPVARHVAESAVLAQTHGVRIDVAMTGHAGRGGVLERLAPMARIASGVAMPADQRKRPKIVIERRLLPALLGMARLAALAQLQAVRIVLAMAADAGARGLRGMQRSAMAVLARDSAMSTAQRKLRLPVMFEGDVGPAAGAVASGAIDPVASVVAVIVAVTCDAFERSAPELGWGPVAVGAGRTLVAAGQRKPGP